MRFTTLTVGAVALLSPFASALSAAGIIDALNTLTSMTEAIQNPADVITLLNGPLYIIGLGPIPTIIDGLEDILKSGGTDVVSTTNNPTITSATDEENIFNAYRTFVSTQITLFTTLNTKAGLFQDLPIVGVPIANVFRSVLGMVDGLALNLITLAPDEAANIAFQQASLDKILSQAINTYSGLQLKKREIAFNA